MADEYMQMFEGQDFETIMQRLMDNHPAGYDKREGSVVWDIYAPFAIEERILFAQLAWMWANIYGDTASRESLIRLALDRDVHILPSSQAKLEGRFNVEVESGQLFNANKINYIVTDFIEEKDGLYYYEMICQIPGEIGNEHLGKITPVNNIEGLQVAELTRVLIPGEDAEDTESFRQRYYHSIRNRDYGFNISEYVTEVNKMPGVGAVRVYPAYPKNGDVTLVILDSNFEPATPELVSEVQEALDPVPYKQKGVGIVPIGHYVLVESAVADDINIDVTIELRPEVTLESLKPRIEEQIEKYLAELRQDFEIDYVPTNYNATKRTIVRESFIETSILDLNEEFNNLIVDVRVTAINGEAGNYEVVKDGVPVLGVINYAP